jgi:transposase-like protein
MVGCKNCKSEQVIKSGIVRGKQRYQCKERGYNFVESDGRTNEKIVAKKTMCVAVFS